MIRDWEQPTPLPFQPPQTSEKMEPSLQMSQEILKGPSSPGTSSNRID